MHITTEMIMTQCQYIIYTVDFKGNRSQPTHVERILANFMYHKKVRCGHLPAVDACFLSLLIYAILLLAQDIFMAHLTYIRPKQTTCGATNETENLSLHVGHMGNPYTTAEMDPV